MALPAVGDGRVPVRDGRVPVRGVDGSGPRGGGVFLPRVQQTRLLDAAVGVVAEEGLKRLCATRVSARAGMSSKTFYDLFADGEDCFLGVFDRAVDELAVVLAAAWAGEGEWVGRVRGALVVLLGCLERDPVLARIVFVEALGAGPRVLARRAEVLDRVARFIDEGRESPRAPAGLPPLVAASVAGAAFSVIHAGLLAERPGSLMELVGPVMAAVVLPYRGREASACELARPVPGLPVLPEPFAGVVERGRSRDARRVAPVRLTERTCAVLAAVGGCGGANNRQVAAVAGASAPQISRLLARLAERGLVENRGGSRGGYTKAWWLTAAGAEFLRTGPSAAGAGPGGDGGKKSSSAGAGRPGGRGVSGARSGRSHGRTAGAGLIGREDVLSRLAGGRGAPVGSLDIAELQRVRILRAAAKAVEEHGYTAVTVAHITARARISRRTFYELFMDREQCLLAVLRDIERQLTAELQEADLDGLPWRERVRLGLWTVLRFFDREPVLARFCVVESVRGEGQIAAYREGLLARVADVIAAGGRQSDPDAECSPLVAEGVVGAVVSILSTRLAASGRRAAGRSREEMASGGPVSDLLGELMGLIVLPYLGSGAAREERDRPAPVEPEPAALAVPAAGSKRGGKCLPLDPAPAAGPAPRMTYRTALVLEAIAQTPGLSNLDVARHAQINDQGQVSKLLARLQRNGLVQNTGRGQGQGAPNEWRLTPAGQKLERNIHEHARDHGKRAAA